MAYRLHGTKTFTPMSVAADFSVRLKSWFAGLFIGGKEATTPRSEAIACVSLSTSRVSSNVSCHCPDGLNEAYFPVIS